MQSKLKSLRLESKGVLNSSKVQNAFLKHVITMSENRILFQLARDVQQGQRELEETHMLKVSHHFYSISRHPVSTYYRTEEAWNLGTVLLLQSSLTFKRQKWAARFFTHSNCYLGWV